MRIGVVSDPHGCLVRLKATLDWLEEEGVDVIVCAGDVANFGPQPNECISLLVWVNAGSAGRPCDGDPRAVLAVLEQQTNGWKASIHRVPFDLEVAIQVIRKANMPYAERLIETQRKACWW